MSIILKVLPLINSGRKSRRRKSIEGKCSKMFRRNVHSSINTGGDQRLHACSEIERDSCVSNLTIWKSRKTYKSTCNLSRVVLSTHCCLTRLDWLGKQKVTQLPILILRCLETRWTEVCFKVKVIAFGLSLLLRRYSRKRGRPKLCLRIQQYNMGPCAYHWLISKTGLFSSLS